MLETVKKLFKFKRDILTKSSVLLIEEYNGREEEFVDTIEEFIDADNMLYANTSLIYKLTNVLKEMKNNVEIDVLEKIDSLLTDFDIYVKSDEFSKEYLTFNWVQNQAKYRCIPEHAFTCFDLGDMKKYVAEDFIILGELLDNNLDLKSINPDLVLSTINYMITKYPSLINEDKNVFGNINLYLRELDHWYFKPLDFGKRRFYTRTCDRFMELRNKDVEKSR